MRCSSRGVRSNGERRQALRKRPILRDVDQLSAEAATSSRRVHDKAHQLGSIASLEGKTMLDVHPPKQPLAASGNDNDNDNVVTFVRK